MIDYQEDPDFDRACWAAFVAAWIGLVVGLVSSHAQPNTFDLLLDGIGYAVFFGVVVFAVVAGGAAIVRAWKARR